MSARAALWSIDRREVVCRTCGRKGSAEESADESADVCSSKLFRDPHPHTRHWLDQMNSAELLLFQPRFCNTQSPFRNVFRARFLCWSSQQGSRMLLCIRFEPRVQSNVQLSQH